MLGDLSAAYESNGNAGAISDGYLDLGGVSYGAYQFSSAAGTIDDYIHWLQNHSCTVYQEWGDRLGNLNPGQDDFNALWRHLAASYEQDFAMSQFQFVKAHFFEPACQVLENIGFHLPKHSQVMADVVWSRAVHYGCGLIEELWTRACQNLGYPNLTYVDWWTFDWDMIDHIYRVCDSREWNHGPWRIPLHNRFISEKKEALWLFEKEIPSLQKKL